MLKHGEISRGSYSRNRLWALSFAVRPYRFPTFPSETKRHFWNPVVRQTRAIGNCCLRFFFAKIASTWELTVDLFASACIAQLNQFVSWFPHPDA